MKKVLFLYLTAFSRTGGIEKFNRSFLKALADISVDGVMDVLAISSHDITADKKYIAATKFNGFAGNKVGFLLSTVYHAFRYNTIIIGHINLALVGCIIKLLRPSVQLIVITHGIEVFEPLTGFKKQLLHRAGIILSVSNYTKSQLINFNQEIDPNKIKIFPNTIDPYFTVPSIFEKPDYLLQRYHLNNAEIVLTIARLASSEQYKGYDTVIKAWQEVLHQRPSLQYLIFGKADTCEKEKVEGLIDEYGFTNSVHLMGYIKEEELTDHYLLADVFVIPSKKEGFGIVFIEAMACGKKVVAGNQDGSVDALLNGELGTLVNPDDLQALSAAIVSSLDHQSNPFDIQQKVMAVFGFPQFKQRLQNYLA